MPQAALPRDTPDQQLASHPELSAWVSANAGTGKTKVLTDRVIRLLLHGASPDRILCITYTKAAAAEMAERVEARLGAWAVMEEDTLAHSLETLTGAPADAALRARARGLFARIIDAPQRLRIQTIHSFCQSVLTRFPLEADIAPNFSLIDDRESAALLEEARQKLFQEARGVPELEDAVTGLALMLNENAFNEALQQILANRRKFIPHFREEYGKEQLREQLGRTLGIQKGQSEVSLRERYFSYTGEERLQLRAVLGVLGTSQAATDQKTFAALARWMEHASQADARTAEIYASYYLTEKRTPLARLCTGDVQKKSESLKDLLETEQRRSVAFLEALETHRIWLRSLWIIEIAYALFGIYRQLKQFHNYMDYDDLILSTLHLLRKDGQAAWVLYKLDGGIDHLLVDEAQDTGPEQWDIIARLIDEFFAGQGAVSRPRTLFAVGDEKQSIYSFQGADPLAFDAVQRQVARKSEQAGLPFRRVRLDRSFRSTAPVLAAVDAVFARDEARDGLVFSEHVISHAVHRAGVGGCVECWPLIQSPEAEEEPEEDELSRAPKAERMTADLIADTIAGWLTEGRRLASRNTPVTAGDILILVQTRNAFSGHMLRALKRRNIPVAGADRLIITDHIAAQDCMALADFLLLPEDDMTLGLLLKSPFCDLSEDALFALAYGRGEQPLWDRLRAAPEHEETARFLSDMLRITDYVSPYELFVHALETWDGRRKLAARLGPEMDDPLREFLTLALDYDYKNPPSLQGFMQWLRAGTTQIKRDMEPGRQEVRIMTVHGAKGLQAPIVFLPDTTSPPKLDKGIHWSEKDGSPLWAPAAEFENAHYRTLKQQGKRSRAQENRRLLYVAMTRAEDELYICGWQGKKKSGAECWYALMRRGLETAENLQTLEDGRLRLEAPQTDEPLARHGARDSLPSIPLPSWAFRPPADEPTPPRPLAPSKLDEDIPALSPMQARHAFERGILVHRLLQYLPDIPPAERDSAVARLSARYGSHLEPEALLRVANEVNAVLTHPEFRHAFGPDSAAEVSVSGTIADADGKPLILSGRVDRLAVMAEDVYILDYKTNRAVPKGDAVPRGYIRQLDAYRRLLQAIYPTRRIHAALLWTAGPKLVTLP